MIKVSEIKEEKKYVCDLEEGDIALIKDSFDVMMVVYVFRSTRNDSLSMVSLSKKLRHWSDTLGKNTLPVLHVFNPGETLKIA